MNAKSETIMEQSEEKVENDIEVTEDQLNNDKLAKLKAKMAQKNQQEEVSQPQTAKKKSIRFGVIGSGQGGSRLSACFNKLGYDAIAINTAQQDLEHIELPEQNKLLLEYGLGGAGKELDIGHAAADTYRESINELIRKRIGDAQLLLFCTSLGGGSGAGSAEVIVDILALLGKPIVVMTILPMSTDDAQTKHNALVTLSKFAKMAQNRKIDNLIVVDNARIETIYSDVGSLNFFKVANQAIVEPIDVFNTLSSAPSSVKSLDPTEFAKVFADGQGLTVYGTMSVTNYTDETAMAEAVIDNLSNNMLASGFDLKQARYVGVMFVANERTWNKIPNSSVNYAMSIINDTCKSPLGLFRGIYSVDDCDDDVVKVYSMFSGLGLPTDRVEQLKNETKEKMAQASVKDEQRNLALKLDTGTEETVSAADAIKKRIADKKSAFGKIHSNAVIDRRKK